MKRLSLRVRDRGEDGLADVDVEWLARGLGLKFGWMRVDEDGCSVSWLDEDSGNYTHLLFL